MASGNTGKTTLHDKLRKILALTTSSVEGEAQAALIALHRLLEEHNLSIADLEQRGQSRPELAKGDVDLGKAAFKWKLNLADVIADHYYCYSLTDHVSKQVRFVGRPDNVESLKMLYTWVVEQIKVISAQERRNHFVRTNEHIDPLRWQVQFGLGAVSRLGTRLREMREQAASEAGTALALSHRSEISDWLESQGRSRIDGKDTANERKWREEAARMAALKRDDPEAYYKLCPWDRPLPPAEQAKADAARAKADAKWNAKWERREERERNKERRPLTEAELRKQDQEYRARSSGRVNADKVNLQPFISGETAKKEVK